MVKKVLVTGATGNIGGTIIPQLVEKGILVNAYVHNIAKAGNIKLRGVEIFEGEFTNQELMNKAASGTDVVVSITPPNPDAVAQARSITNAAKTARVKHIIRISAIGAAKDAPTDNGRLHHVTDEEIIASGIPYTILRPHFFMQNLFWAISNIVNEGKMYFGMGEGRIGIIDVRDIADCAINIIVNGGHINKIYTPTGPASISFSDMASVISKGLGKTVNYVAVPVEAVRDSIRQMGMSEWFAKVMMDYSRAYGSGWGDFANTDVEIVSKHKPRSFQQFFDEVFKFALQEQAVTTN